MKRGSRPKEIPVGRSDITRARLYPAIAEGVKSPQRPHDEDLRARFTSDGAKGNPSGANISNVHISSSLAQHLTLACS